MDDKCGQLPFQLAVISGHEGIIRKFVDEGVEFHRAVSKIFNSCKLKPWNQILSN